MMKIKINREDCHGCHFYRENGDFSSVCSLYGQVFVPDGKQDYNGDLDLTSFEAPKFCDADFVFVRESYDSIKGTLNDPNLPKKDRIFLNCAIAFTAFLMLSALGGLAIGLVTIIREVYSGNFR